MSYEMFLIIEEMRCITRRKDFALIPGLNLSAQIKNQVVIIKKDGDVCRLAEEICKLGSWCWYFSHGGQITGKGRGHRASTPTSLPSSVLISNAILPVLHSPFSPDLSKAHSPVTGFQLQLLLVSLPSEKSTSLEPSYQNLLQQGCWLKLSGMTCGVDGASRGV